ncbi:MAG: YARHG domain-containing protein [Verrucomicrobia bacterium]|nr:YARHG domain-containing protein [Verrucomicrobiota bacterium]MBV8277623.1 YARHG domain-containing protein [Verrucomicrobiota bacterium]
MKACFGLAAIFFIFVGRLCAQESIRSADPVAVASPSLGVSEFSGALGLYIGPFSNGRITVSITEAKGSTVTGYSVYKANIQTFTGTIARNKNTFTMVLNEAGDDPDDGVFNLTLDGSRLSGSWTANDGRLRPVSMTLERTEFHYDPKAGKYPQTSTTPLKARDVENMKSDVLRIMRNEIYARHGYCFQLQDMRNYFLAQPWYVPASRNVEDQLTEIERRNAALIKQYENYGAEYYDRFGR